MSKPALLIGLDGALQILAVPGGNGAMPPAVLRVPVPTLSTRTPRGPERADQSVPSRDRTFRYQGELRHYWIYEEEW